MPASRRRTRPALLAVDGGGSKIDAALLSRRGEVVGAARLVQADHDGTGSDSHLKGITDAVRRACAEAGVSADARPVADLGVYCLAGADLPADDRRIGRWLKGSGLTRRDVVRNDTFAVMRAGTERSWGVAVVCGYGTNCSGVAPAGRMFRFPAVGSISGDWGGGMDVGKAALWHAIRAEDGRGEKTELARGVSAHFGLRRPRQVMEAMYFGRIPERRVVELPPIVFRAAVAGDGVARQIVDHQADEVVAMAGTAIRRLRMTRLDVDVVLGGGIFRNEDPAFLDRIGDGVRGVAPRARVHRLEAPPVVGAALIGLDEIGASAGAGARTRRELTHERMAGARRRLR
jgi:N-acetylglucosamine kinase-like BadF-type ATPase